MIYRKARAAVDIIISELILLLQLRQNMYCILAKSFSVISIKLLLFSVLAKVKYTKKTSFPKNLQSNLNILRIFLINNEQ